MRLEREFWPLYLRLKERERAELHWWLALNPEYPFKAIR